MSPLITQTASQGSEMWKAVPLSLPIPLQNCPALGVAPAWATLDVHTDSQKASATEGSFSKPTKRSNADLIVDEIHGVVASAGATPETTPRPTDEAVSKVISVISPVKDSLLKGADVDTLHGEINLTWNDRAKQIILICRADQGALVHHHQHIEGKF